MNNIALREWIKNFNEGKYELNNRVRQIEAGWWDWFCNDSSLANKTKRLGNIVKQIKDGGKIDLDNMYVWFTNNCPVMDPLYDTIRFSTLADGEPQFVVCCNDKRENKRYAVYSRKDGFSKPLFETNYSKELIKWFNTKE